MREILFKGKREDNGEWVFGSYRKLPDCTGMTHIIDVPAGNPDDANKIFFVNPETVCQYIGLTDRNNEKIFENDIVTSAEFCPDNEGYGVVQWRDDEAKFVIETDYSWYDFYNYWGAEVEVIGNMFENPELIRGVEE